MVTDQVASRSRIRLGILPKGCLSVFFLIFMVAGGLVTFFFTIRPIWSSLAASNWKSVPCTILSSRVHENRGDSDSGPTYLIEMEYRYEIDGKFYQGDRYNFVSFSSSGRTAKQKVVKQHPVGAERTCYVDPKDPSRSVINPSITLSMFIGLFGLIFIVVGLGGIFFINRLLSQFDVRRLLNRKLPETTRADWLPSPQIGNEGSDKYGGFGAQTGSGPITLQPKTSPIRRLLGTALFCLFWNGITSIFVVISVIEYRKGDPQWFMMIFLIPFVGIGLVLFFLVFRYLLGLFNPRPTLTLKSCDISLGDPVHVSWKYTGQTSSIRQMKLVLHGKEQAEYRRGTSTYHDEETFVEISLVDTTDPFTIMSGEAETSIPTDSMHSFEGGHNKIVWSLKITGDIAFWTDVQEEFTIVVSPKLLTEQNHSDFWPMPVDHE